MQLKSQLERELEEEYQRLPEEICQHLQLELEHKGAPQGRPVLALLQPQQPRLRLGAALQLLHALLPVDAQPGQL